MKSEDQEQPRELDLIINVDEVDNSDPFVDNQKDLQEIKQENTKN